MPRSKKTHHRPKAPDATRRPSEGFQFLAPPDDPDAPHRKAIPGIYRISFPTCEVCRKGKLLGLRVRMTMTGPLESEAPRTLQYELDIADSFPAIQEQFRLLGVESLDEGDLHLACDAVQRRVDHVDQFLYLGEDGQRSLGREFRTPEEVAARLRGETRTHPRLRIAPALLPTNEEMGGGTKPSRVARQKLSRQFIFWATIIRCEAFPMKGRAGYEVAWEVRIDAYDDEPLIHRWKQRVDSIQSYEELRRDLEVLCVKLNSYQEIEQACRAALGKNIIVEYPLRDMARVKASLLEHFTEKPHQLPPLQERMTRAEAEEYVRQHKLEAFAGNLREMRFVDGGAPRANTGADSEPTTPFPNTNRPMQPLFGDTLTSYELVQMPVEPYASEDTARDGTYRLRGTHCTVRKQNRFYFTHIRLELVCEELEPPFRAIYELNRKLTYTQLCAEFRKLRVMVHSKEGIKSACKSVLKEIASAQCLPEDAPDWLCQNAGLN